MNGYPSNEDLGAAVLKHVEVCSGVFAAQQAVQEALLGTILKQFPPLADLFLEILRLSEDHQRQQMGPDDHVAHSTLTNHLVNIREMVEHMKAQ